MSRSGNRGWFVLGAAWVTVVACGLFAATVPRHFLSGHESSSTPPAPPPPPPLPLPASPVPPSSPVDFPPPDIIVSSLVGPEPEPASEPAPKPVDPAEIDRLVADLRDDDIPRNALLAREVLAAIGRPAIAPLERALDSDDAQQRHYAALTLCEIDAYRPTDDRFARVLIDAMRDDDVRWNADEAVLRLRWTSDAVRKMVAPALESALDSDDWQQRQIAAYVLCDVKDHIPSDRMLAVLVEALRDDALPSGPPARKGGGWTYNYVNNATVAFHVLHAHHGRAEPHLLDVLDSADLQQRFLASVLLIANGSKAAEVTAVPLLIEHLRDNRHNADAVMAARALGRYGPGVLPYLERATGKTDTQQRALIRMIQVTLTQPDVVTPMLTRELGMRNVTTLIHNPAGQGPVQRRFRFDYSRP